MGTVPYKAYGAVNLVSETSDASLHKITTNGLEENDVAIAIEDSKVYFYRIDEDSGEDQNVPYVIKPEDETGNKRWVLISQETYATDIIQLVDNYIQTSHIKAIDGESIEIESSNGSKIVIDANGSVTFPSFVSASFSPSASSHLTNKSYVDTEFDSKQSSLETYVDNEIVTIKTELESYTDNEFSTLETELYNYIDTETESLSGNLITYIDNEINAKETELYNYIDTETESLSGNLISYVDSEIDNVITNVYPILSFTINIADWVSSANSYYYDVTHNKGFDELVIRCWNETNEMVFPENIESIDVNNTRIWIEDNINLTVLVL